MRGAPPQKFSNGFSLFPSLRQRGKAPPRRLPCGFSKCGFRRLSPAENRIVFPLCRLPALFRRKAAILRYCATDCIFSAENQAAYRCVAPYISPYIPFWIYALLSPRRAPFLWNFPAFSYTVFSCLRSYPLFPFIKFFRLFRIRKKAKMIA